MKTVPKDERSLAPHEEFVVEFKDFAIVKETLTKDILLIHYCTSSGEVDTIGHIVDLAKGRCTGIRNCKVSKNLIDKTRFLQKMMDM